MKKTTTILLCLLFTLIKANAATVDWYLYLWLTTNSTKLGDVQFETTDDPNIFRISNFKLTEQGVNFCVHNKAWSTQYGWKSVGGVLQRARLSP